MLQRSLRWSVRAQRRLVDQVCVVQVLRYHLQERLLPSGRCLQWYRHHLGLYVFLLLLVVSAELELTSALSFSLSQQLWRHRQGLLLHTLGCRRLVQEFGVHRHQLPLWLHHQLQHLRQVVVGFATRSRQEVQDYRPQVALPRPRDGLPHRWRRLLRHGRLAPLLGVRRPHHWHGRRWRIRVLGYHPGSRLVRRLRFDRRGTGLHQNPFVRLFLLATSPELWLTFSSPNSAVGVGCDSGACVVFSCQAGWRPNLAGTKCIRAHHQHDSSNSTRAHGSRRHLAARHGHHGHGHS